MDMHPSSLDNMQTCYQRYVVPSGLAARAGVAILDLAGADVNGSYRPIFAGPQFAYRTADIAAGLGVDLVLEETPTASPCPTPPWTSSCPERCWSTASFSG